MKLVSRHSSPVTFAAVLAAASATAAVSDFTRTEVSDWNGREGVTFVRWSKGGTPRGFAFAFDLAKGYRFRAWHGAANTNGTGTATIGNMAETMAAAGEAPLAGINGDYFDNTGIAVSHTSGMTISDSRVSFPGWNASPSTAFCYIAGLADGNLHHGKVDCMPGYEGGNPAASWLVNVGGRHIRNAVRTNYQNYPVRAGAINPVGGGNSTSGYDFSTTIGNYQSRNYYWRTLVGIGTNAVGVATNLVLFTSDPSGSGGFPDVDAYRMMIDLGCNEVGELDGGGSATMWAEAGSDAVFLGATTAHGGYVMKPRDTSPRKVGNGIFVLPPDPRPQTVEVATGNFYTTLEEALDARAPNEYVSIHAATVASDAVLGRAFRLRNASTAASLVRCATNSVLVGEAVAVSDGISLRWTPGVSLVGAASAPGYDLTNGVATVTVSLAGAAEIPDGTKVRMTVSDTKGNIRGTADLPCPTAGDYAFNTASIPGLNLTGNFDYALSFSLVDAGGASLPLAADAVCDLRLASYAPWFSADIIAGTTTGGTWIAAPGSAGILPAASRASSPRPYSGFATFAADEPRDGVVRVEIALENDSGFDEDSLPALLATCAEAGARAALLQVLSATDDETCSWRGLVVENGALAWKPLYGFSPPAGQPRRAFAEIDLSGTSPRVSYLAGGVGGSPAIVRLRSSSGATWFPAPGSGSSCAGRVTLHGTGLVAALDGTSLDKAVAEVGGVRYDSLADALRAVGPGGTVKLLSNATAPISLLRGRTVVTDGWDLIALAVPLKGTRIMVQ
ncbi:MAG: phosphodiester glycosidase family protein [Kiritimatiellae bacterium]|nr:phosphodiester glycosidase family protein [Kiritimatiellia bacterium]